MSTSSSESERNSVAATLLSDADRQKIAQIAVTLDASKCGCVHFGVCNNRLKIDAIEAALEQALSTHGMDVGRVVLAERDTGTEIPTYRVHITNPFDHFDTLPQPHSQLYFIHGLPELIRLQTAGDNSRVAPVSQLLNYRREYFRDQRLCVLFWLDPETVPYVMQNAPDFWSFRSGMARFGDTVDASQVRDSSGWQQSAPSGLSSGELEERLRQLAVYRKKTPPDENAIANLLLDIGRLHVNRHEFQDAFNMLHEAESIFETLGLRQRVSAVRTWLSRAFRKTGQLDKAEESIRHAIEIDQEYQSEASLASDYTDLSQLYKVRGQLEEAEKWLRTAIEIAEPLGDELALAARYNNLSQIYKARGQLEEAEKWLRKAIEIAERLGDQPNLAINYNNLSQIHKARGQLEEAEKWLRKAIEIDERLGDEPKLAIDYNNLSQINKARGQLEEAEKWLRKAIEIAERLGDELHLAIDYNNLSQINEARGQLEEAEKWLRKAIALMEPKGPSTTLETLRSNLEQLEREKKQQTHTS